MGEPKEAWDEWWTEADKNTHFFRERKKYRLNLKDKRGGEITCN